MRAPFKTVQNRSGLPLLLFFSYIMGIPPMPIDELPLLLAALSFFYLVKNGKISPL